MKPSAFVDTSVIIRYILGEKGAFTSLGKFGHIYASELLRVESLRTIDRLRIQNSWASDEVALRVRLLTAVGQAIEWAPIQDPILRRAAEPFPVVAGTLDAIHISTALLLQTQLKKDLLFLTHDLRQGEAAEACGMEIGGC